MSEPEYCVSCGARALRDLDGGLAGWAATIAMDPDCDHSWSAPRTLVINGALARHMMRQHLTLSGITYSEVRDDNMSQVRSTFTFEAGGDVFAEAEAYAREVMT